MNSLFSSFDMKFFPHSIALLLSILVMFYMNFFKISSFLSFLNFPLNYLEDFFLSLKPKKFSKIFLSLLSVMFFVILLLNILSVFSFSFPLTSQLSYVLMFSLSIWLSFVIFFFYSNMKGFLSHLIPEGAPLGLTPILFLIELVSNIIRPITLTVRLCANILAGHLLMILLSNLVFSNSFTFIFYLLLNIVELFVGMIQSYIFCTMICLYFSEID